MTSHASTVAFQGIEALAVDVQAHFLSGQVQFNIVGLGDKAVAESRERVRAALHAIGVAPHRRLAMPSWEAIKLVVARGDAIAAISRLAIRD